MTARNAYFTPAEGDRGRWHSQTMDGNQTNVLTAPDDLSNAAWTKTNVTVASAGAAGQNILETVTNGAHSALQSYTKAASAKTYRLMFKVKANGRTAFRLEFTNGAAAYVRADVDLVRPALTALAESGFSANGVTISQAGDGYYQINAVIRTDAATTLTAAVILSNGSALSYVGDTAKGVYLTGFVLDELA